MRRTERLLIAQGGGGQTRTANRHSKSFFSNMIDEDEEDARLTGLLFLSLSRLHWQAYVSRHLPLVIRQAFLEDLADPQLAKGEKLAKPLVVSSRGGVERLGRDTKLLNGYGGLCFRRIFNSLAGFKITRKLPFWLYDDSALPITCLSQVDK